MASLVCGLVLPMELRPYQHDLIERLRASYRSGKRAPILVCSTGSGKTVMFSHITASAAERGHRTLILAHRRELIKQASDKLKKFGVSHAICMPGHGASTHDIVVVGSVQTVAHRLPQLGSFQLVVIDEAHHATASSWRTILAAQPQSKLLGVTATPARLDGSPLGAHCSGFFDDLIEGPSMPWLVSQGYLAPIVAYAPANKSIDNIKLRKRSGEFAPEDDAAIMDKPTITGDAISHYQRYAAGKQGIVSCCTVEHATHVAEAFLAANVPTEVIHGAMKTPERDAVLKRFADGEIQLLTFCALIGEGLDVPNATVLIGLRHTASLTLWRQFCGRVMRPLPGKTAIILDHVKNIKRHGLPDEPVEWSLDGKPKRPNDDEKVKRRWDCPECYRQCYSYELKCPDCGTEKPREKRELPKQVAGELVPVLRPWEQLNLPFEQYQAIIHEREQRRMEQDRIWAAKYAAKMGYKNGWVEHVVTAKSEARKQAAFSGRAVPMPKIQPEQQNLRKVS